MDKTQQVKRMTYVMTRLVDYMSKKLPDDVENKLRELAAQETNTLAKLLYETYFKNQDEALRLNRPSCQDTGLLQFFVRCGSEFPLILNLEGVLREAVKQPLRHLCVTMRLKLSTNITPVLTSGRMPLPYFGRLFPVTDVRLTHIWQAADARFLAMLWCSCRETDMKAL